MRTRTRRVRWPVISGLRWRRGYFFSEEQSDLPEAVDRGITGELDRVIAGEEAIWFNAKKAGVTPTELFDPFPQEEADPDSIPSIVAALQKNVGTLRQSGHNVIFASLAVRALMDHEELATPSIVSGVVKLIEGFNRAPAGRGYYGKQTGWKTGGNVELDENTNLPKYGSIAQMLRVTVDELIASASIKRQGFGGLWHLINHAAGIVELDRFGFKEVARNALAAHHHHIRLWRSLPDVEEELGAVVKAPHDPRQAVYWDGMLKRDQARLTHRVKTLYGYGTIRAAISDESKRREADDAFLYLMA